MAKSAKETTTSMVRLEDFTSLDDAATAVGDGGQVLIYDGSLNGWHWTVHPQGALMLRYYPNSDVYLNGRPLVAGGRQWGEREVHPLSGNWCVHPLGIVTRPSEKNGRLWLNQRDLLYDGPNFGWDVNHRGEVIVNVSSEKGYGHLVLNGREPALYDGPCDDWRVYPHGFVVAIGSRDGYKRLLLNGREPPVYEGYGCWHTHPSGLIVDVSRYGREYSRILLNGREPPLYEGPNADGIACRSHPQGVVVRLGKYEKSRFLLNGNLLLCESACFVQWEVHSRGILIQRHGDRDDHYQIILFVCKQFDICDPHPGIVVPEWIEKL